MSTDYWTNKLLSRRRALRGAAGLGAGLTALSLIGCGRGQTENGSAAQPAAKELDSTKGVPGGTMTFQASFPPNFSLITIRNSSAARAGGLTNSGLLSYRSGRPGVDGTAIDVEPDLSQALPEQPDPLTYVFKLRKANFHNGRPVTPEDVKYSLDRYAFDEKSAFKSFYTWLDKIDAPDPQTVVIKTKNPFADAVQSLALYNDPFIVAKEHEEGPDAATKYMGSGPFIFVGAQPPVSLSFRKNPDYFMKPYPYFDEVKFFTPTDDAKRVADFSARNLTMLNWVPEEARDQLKQARPDAQTWAYPAAGQSTYFRTDRAPFNDKRLRQALSQSLNRKQIRDAASKGEGEPDQLLSIINRAWGFRKPSELKAAKLWNFDPAEAKKLFAATGLSGPVEGVMPHMDVAAAGQGLQDTVTLIITQWKEIGFANIKDMPVPGSQYLAGANFGMFENFAHGFNQQNIVFGAFFRNTYWSPPEGVKTPSINAGHVNDATLSALLDKQLGQFNREERKATFRDIEELTADEQYRVIGSTYSQTYFADPSLKNAQPPLFFFNGSADFFKYWWLAKA